MGLFTLKRHRKAQLFSTDVMMAVVLVGIMVALVMIYWATSSSEINLRQKRIEMQRAALDAGNYLTRVLLVNSTGELSKNALQNFTTGCNYQAEKTNIGLGGFDFFLNLSYLNGTPVRINSSNVTCGLNFANSSNLMAARRLSVYEGNEVIIDLYVWK